MFLAILRALSEQARNGDGNATLALEMFSYEGAQAIAKMTVALGGLDQLVFTGGIGEHSAEVRAAICETLGFVGVSLDAAANAGSN